MFRLKKIIKKLLKDEPRDCELYQVLPVISFFMSIPRMGRGPGIDYDRLDSMGYFTITFMTPEGQRINTLVEPKYYSHRYIMDYIRQYKPARFESLESKLKKYKLN